MTRPQEAISTYLDSRRSEVAESTITSHKSRLGQFCGWFEQQDDIEIMADLSPLDLTQYRSWRREDGTTTSSHAGHSVHTLGAVILLVLNKNLPFRYVLTTFRTATEELPCEQISECFPIRDVAVTG